MPKLMLIIVALAVVSTVGVLGYTYRQGIKISTKVCDEDRLRQELSNKNAEIKIEKDMVRFNADLVDEATKQLDLQAQQVSKLESTINELLSKPTDDDISYQCVPDSVLQDLRKLRLLRGAVR